MSAPCAPDANAAASGSPIGQESPLNEPLTCSPYVFQWRPDPMSDQLIHQLQTLCTAMLAQTEAINRLAASNEALVQAMSEAEDEEEGQQGSYMDGSPRR
jgi:hypothetical protein